MRLKYHYIFPLLFVLIFFTLALLSSNASAGKLYKWTDKDGQVHITDYPPPESQLKNGSEIVIEDKKDKVGLDGETLRKAASFLEEKHKKIRSDLSRRAEQSVTQFRTKGTLLKLVIIGIIVFLHLYYALCLYISSRKIGVSTALLAWVPLLNFFPLVNAAGKPWWWAVIFLLPLTGIIPTLNSHVYIVIVMLLLLIVDFVLFIVIWIRVCNNLWIDKRLGLLILVPVVQLVLIGYLAFKHEPHIDRIRRLRPALTAFFSFLVILGAAYAALQLM
jgi:hypothetical protein